MLGEAQREIDLFREYRTRLIADVVTGKLDVRGVNLPAIEETYELELIESTDDIEADALDETKELTYHFWLNILNNRDPNNYSGIVCSFITSAEYQKRFGSVVTHSNSECGQ